MTTFIPVLPISHTDIWVLYLFIVFIIPFYCLSFRFVLLHCMFINKRNETKRKPLLTSYLLTYNNNNNKNNNVLSYTIYREKERNNSHTYIRKKEIPKLQNYRVSKIKQTNTYAHIHTFISWCCYIKLFHLVNFHLFSS